MDADERPMCDRVTDYVKEHQGGKCPRRATHKYVNRDTDEAHFRCSVHATYAHGWSRFRIGKDGKTILFSDAQP